MESIATGLSNFLAASNAEAGKEIRIAQNNQRFKNAIASTWSDNPNAVAFLLAHTNSIYVAKDEAPRKGRDKDRDYLVLGLYLDDALVRSEINARREKLRFALAQEGMHVDEIRDHLATRDMKDRHVFPDAVEQANELFGRTSLHDPYRKLARRTDVDHVGADQSDLLETVKRAFCLAFEDPDRAFAVLDEVEGAALSVVGFSKKAARGKRGYRCHLYVDESRVEQMESVVRRFGETVVSRAKPLGLDIREILVHKSPESLSGRKAFPRVGLPEPLGDVELQELRSESSRVADEVRRKIRGAS